MPNGRNLIVEYRIFGAANGGQQFNYRLDRADYYSPGANPRTAVLAANGVPSQVTTGSKNSYYCPVAFFEHQ